MTLYVSLGKTQALYPLSLGIRETSNHSSLLLFLVATERFCLCFGVIRCIFEVDKKDEDN